jgi:Na+/H+ antiporter NhaD/arsenite permease-like protein
MIAPFEFFIFGAALLGIAISHRHALPIAVGGLVVAALYKLIAATGGPMAGAHELLTHFAEKWVILANLLLLLLGFAVLSSHFEQSKLPDAIRTWLPDGWQGSLVLLAIVFVLSMFLDNIAGAVIGGVVARHVFRNRVSIGFLAAIVAAANAGGAGSVIGDTTTTMMWIRGVSPLEVAPAFIGALSAFAIFGVAAAFQQRSFGSVHRVVLPNSQIDWTRLYVVALLLLALLGTNLLVNGVFPHLESTVPMLGLGLWVATIATTSLRRPDWSVLNHALTGAVFLVTLVALASLMPVDHLPPPSSATVFGLGVLSALFDNIPLTALALDQGGYDWGLLAYAVGFGGSMIWFGSSAGVALTNLYPEGRSVGKWLRQGWHVPIAYVVGFGVMLMAQNAFQ